MAGVREAGPTRRKCTRRDELSLRVLVGARASAIRAPMVQDPVGCNAIDSARLVRYHRRGFRREDHATRNPMDRSTLHRRIRRPRPCLSGWHGELLPPRREDPLRVHRWRRRTSQLCGGPAHLGGLRVRRGWRLDGGSRRRNEPGCQRRPRRRRGRRRPLSACRTVRARRPPAPSRATAPRRALRLGRGGSASPRCSRRSTPPSSCPRRGAPPGSTAWRLPAECS